jgi:hypothetical protein
MEPDMLDPQFAAAFAQFGAAGLIGWMWLSERRAAAARERQLGEAHDRLVQERPQLGALIRIVSDNTRALATMESGQRRLAAVLERLAAASAPHAGGLGKKNPCRLREAAGAKGRRFPKPGVTGSPGRSG